MPVDLQISDLPLKSSVVSTDQYGVDDASRVTWRVTSAQILTYIQTNIQIAESQVTNLTTDLGNRLLNSNNLSDVSNKTTAFNNLSPLSTKGDLIVYNGSNDVRLPIGTNTYVLTADSTQTNGLAWEAVPGAGGVTPQFASYGLNASTSTNGLILWDTLIVDANFIQGSGSITPTLPGWYFATLELTFFASSANTATMSITCNHAGSVTSKATIQVPVGAARVSATTQGFFFCNGSADTIQMSWTSVGTINIGGDVTQNKFTVTRISSS
jgi:hypothetical protein